MVKHTKMDPYVSESDNGAIQRGWAAGTSQNQSLDDTGERAKLEYHNREENTGPQRQPVTSGTEERVHAPFKNDRI